MSSISLLNGRQAQVPTQIFINNEWVSPRAEGMWGSTEQANGPLVRCLRTHR